MTKKISMKGFEKPKTNTLGTYIAVVISFLIAMTIALGLLAAIKFLIGYVFL